MKYFILSLLLVPITITAEEMCDVTLCNKVERFTLNVWKHINDEIGEVCFDALLPKSKAIKGKIVDSEWRGYSGNFTKNSVTRITNVKECK